MFGCLAKKTSSLTAYVTLNFIGQQPKHHTMSNLQNMSMFDHMVAYLHGPTLVFELLRISSFKPVHKPNIRQISTKCTGVKMV